MPIPNADEDNYDTAPPPPPANGESEGSEPKPDNEGGETALIPASLCPGMKPGDEVTVKIEAQHGDQYAISYPGKSEPKEESSEMEQAPMPASMAGNDPNYE